MKIIDLLNKIANGEKLPTKIKYCYQIYSVGAVGEDYYNYENNCWFFRDKFDTSIINEELDIIEENKKIEKINKLYKYKEELGEDYYENILKIYDGGEYEINKDMSFVIDKINEIIEVINNGIMD